MARYRYQIFESTDSDIENKATYRIDLKNVKYCYHPAEQKNVTIENFFQLLLAKCFAHCDQDKFRESFRSVTGPIISSLLYLPRAKKDLGKTKLVIFIIHPKSMKQSLEQTNKRVNKVKPD